MCNYNNNNINNNKLFSLNFLKHFSLKTFLAAKESLRLKSQFNTVYRHLLCIHMFSLIQI